MQLSITHSNHMIDHKVGILLRCEMILAWPLPSTGQNITLSTNNLHRLSAKKVLIVHHFLIQRNKPSIITLY